jgi:hypothetical protein
MIQIEKIQPLQEQFSTFKDNWYDQSTVETNYEITWNNFAIDKPRSKIIISDKNKNIKQFLKLFV